MKNCIITGASSGIGKAAAYQIAAKGYAITLICRNEEITKAICQDIMAQTGNINIDYLIADLSNQKQIISIVQKFYEKNTKLDVLINNAANFDISVKKAQYTDEDNGNIEKQFATNVLAPFLLTEKLMPLLKNSDDPRVINISSKGLMMFPNIKLDFENINSQMSYNAAKTYYQNKLALLMNSLYLRDTIGCKASIYAISVTNVQVDISKYPNVSGFLKSVYSIKSKFSISLEQMAHTYTELATGEKRQGFLYERNKDSVKEVKANKYAYDKEAQCRLYEYCKSLVIKYPSA